MKKAVRIALTLLLFLCFLYVIGPRFPKPNLTAELPQISIPLSDLDQFIEHKDDSLPVKTDNGNQIIWADSAQKVQTDWCLLYLHGFSASRMEGAPTHQNLAQHFGMNAYLPRLASHGLALDEPLLDMTPDRLYESAKEALQIAHLLGKKVLIMSTSTGGTLSLKLAADFPSLVDGLVLLSPNVAINNPAAFLLSKPWGLQLARQVYGGDYRVTNDDPQDEECRYWNCFYRLEAIVYLQQLVDASMNKATFSKVHCPVFLGYYYQDEEHQDEVVRVDAALQMFDQLGTPASLKQAEAFNAGVHVIGCGLYSKSQQQVEQASIRFVREKLSLQD